MANVNSNAKVEVSQSIKDKIAALLAKANGTDNEHEASAFMAKAMEMLGKYQLESWEVRDQQDPFGASAIWSTNKNPVTWRKYLVNAVAMYYGAKSLMTHTAAGVRFDFIGRESARITAAEMYPFILAQVKAWGTKMEKDGTLLNGKPATAKQHTRRVCHSLTFRLTQLVAERAEADKESKTVGSKHALIAVDELQAYMDSLNTTKGKGGKISTGGSAHRDAANGVKLDKPVGAANASAAKLTQASA